MTAAARADKAALRYAGKQHRERADMIVNTELAFAYNRGADIGIKRAIKDGFMGKCEMVWTTAGTNRVCPRCLALKDKVVGHTDEDGVTLPPLHPRCRCAIMYREIAEIKPRSNEPDKPQGTPKPSKQDGFVFDLQRFDAQPMPEGNYNLTVRRQVQNRHIEGTKEYQEYANRLSEKNIMPSKMPADTNCQSLVREFHGKGTYDPNPKDNSPREIVDTGRVIGQYWDTDKNQFVDTTQIKIVYSRKGTHIYPIRPLEE